MYERIREAALCMLMDIDRLEIERARPESEVVPLNVVQAILTGFYSATRHLEYRGRKDKKNKAFEIEDEYDVQDLLYAMLRPVVPDLEREDPTRKVAGKGGFLDFRSDELELILEVKYCDSANRAKALVDECNARIKRYGKREDLSTLAFFIYDPEGYALREHPNFVRDMEGPHRMGGSKEFQVRVVINP